MGGAACNSACLARQGLPAVALQAEREAVLRTVAAVLHLGNIRFAGAADEGCAPRDEPSREALAAIADLLQAGRFAPMAPEPCITCTAAG